MRMCILRMLAAMGALFLMPTLASAIVNIEELGLDTESEQGFSGRAGLALNGASGNTDKLGLATDAQLLWRYGLHTDMLIGSYTYSKTSGVRDTNRSFAHFRHRIRLDEAIAVEGFVQAQQDEFARLSLRALAGAGLRFSWRRQQTSIYLGLGSFYERERLKFEAGTTDPLRTDLWRGNTYLALHHRLNERLRLLNTIYIQPAWQDASDIRLLEEAAMRVHLTKQLDLKLSVELSYDNRPPQQVESTDIIYKTALEFRF
ncbi:MAG: YdiY family protein [Mariprofundaceae bacterium]